MISGGSVKNAERIDAWRRVRSKSFCTRMECSRFLAGRP